MSKDCKKTSKIKKIRIFLDIVKSVLKIVLLVLLIRNLWGNKD